ncbi:MAG: outer membrane beta-barrel domain-containing protein [Deltaproteobacteria bacterium]|nr:outer membrane beta-barrel domain-containing protein [Deltaproteobacteria bacterium]
MKRVIFDRVLMLAVFVLVPCAVNAQDDGMMSFSEEEAEGEGDKGASEEEGTMSFDGEEAESEGEPSDEEGGGTSEADVLSALGEGDSAEASVSLGGDQPEGEQAGAEHPIWAVQRIYALRAGRVDLQPSFGVSMNDPYMQHQAISLGAAYFITEVLAAGVSFNFYRGLDSETNLNFEMSRATHQTVPINEYLAAGQLNFTYVPMYGKFAMFKEWILHWDVWVIGGGGFIFTRPRPKIDPEFRDFDFEMKFCFNVGIGGRLFLSRFLAIFLELRDYIFPEELESLETYSSEEQRSDPANWLDKDYKLTNNVMLQVGVSLFIPFTFEYELPK